MELKLARTQLDAKPKTISLEKIEAAFAKDPQQIFYFDRENSHNSSLWSNFSRKKALASITAPFATA